ncbi:MAG: polysaccharide biosynthesis/export family protein [Fibrobacter sp.]|nr:polysaccharide biosynthesis/export family protein [Fibrobacter sp.]
MRFFKIFTFWLVTLYGFAAVFAAETSSLQALSASNATASVTRNTITMQPSYSEGVIDSSYKLGPGDYLDITLENTYLSVKVYPDGNIIIEECGAVNVAGKTLAEARKEILELVSKRYNPEYCFVQLAQLKKIIVNVMGAVAQVGQVLVEPQTRLSRLLKMVGGILHTGRDEDILVIRGQDTLHINYTKVINEGDFANDVMMEQGDLVYVPFVSLKDAVTIILSNYRSAMAYEEGKTVADYFERAGGNRIPNIGYQSVTIREKDGKSVSLPLQEAEKQVVPPGAEIEYSMKSLFVYVGGAVAGVGRQQYNPVWNALDYIAAAGVTTISGSFDQVKVIRGDRETIYVNATGDQILPGDYIEIPKSNYERFKDFTLFMSSLLTVLASALTIYVYYNK